jgi:hypothetical protein
VQGTEHLGDGQRHDRLALHWPWNAGDNAGKSETCARAMFGSPQITTINCYLNDHIDIWVLWYFPG